MEKIQKILFVTPSQLEIKDNKIFVVKGEFYFQGKKYLIENGEICKSTSVDDSIPF